MARPVISPMSVHATAPEAFEVLNQRMKGVEEQTNTLLKELATLGGGNGHSMEPFPSKPLESSDGHQTISPVRARVAFAGQSDMLWKNCDTLVNRMCRLESVVQTLKLNMFRLQTDKELNPKHAANLEQRLNVIQEEHMQELKVLQAEGRMLRQQLSESREEEEKARDQVQRLSSALEIATATKRDVAVSAEELRVTKNKMNHKLKELKQQLSQETGLRKAMEESQALLLFRMQEMEVAVEKEQLQIHMLHQDCNSLRQGLQLARERLQEEEERAARLEQKCVQLEAELESRESSISRLSEEGKAAQLSFSREQEENTQLRSEMTALREMAAKVQGLNEQLNQQCAELSDNLRSVTMENARLITDHQAVLQVEQDKINQKLQEQDLLLDAARNSIMGELHSLQSEKTQLQRQIDILRVEHADCKQKACTAEEAATTQKELLESTVAKLRSELEAALQETDSLLKEKEGLDEEMKKTVNEITQEKKRLEAALTELELECGPLKATLQALEEENKKLMAREAALELHQHARQQVEQKLADLEDNKSKLACDKGKRQARVQQLEEEMQSQAAAESENSQLHKLHTALETKYKQVTAELGSVRISLQRTEAQLKQCNASPASTPRNLLRSFKSVQETLEGERREASAAPEQFGTEWDVDIDDIDLQMTQSVLDLKEEDYSQVVKSRDDAIRENQKMKEQISATEEREKRKVANLRSKLQEAKEDTLKMTTMLENVLASHHKMQLALDKTRTELGRKESEICSLRKERTQSQQKVQQLEEELEQCHSKLVLEAQYSIKMDPLRKALEDSEGDNQTLAQNLEQALQTNDVLQSKLVLAHEELESKEADYYQLIECRDQLIEEAKVEARFYAERLESLKKQFQTERETAKKAALRESAELRKALEAASSKASDVSRSNRELRAQLVTLEGAAANYKEKLKRQKVLITQYFSSKRTNAQNAERMKEIEAELRQMEELKEQYQKKNHEQAISIREFVSELTSLQSEMKQLAQNQHEVTTRNRNLERQLEVEQKQRQQLEAQNRSLEATVRRLKKCKDDTEQKLKEANIESEQITANLEEAHHWFKSKFESLQRELAQSYLHKIPGEEQQPPVKLPSQACLKRWETKQRLTARPRKSLAEVD